MKFAKLFVVLLAGSVLMCASGQAAEKKTKPKPYTLKTCIISGDKLGEMGAPYVFEYKGHEIKLCCKGCLKDFNKDAPKYLKQIEQAEAKAAKANPKGAEAKPSDKK